MADRPPLPVPIATEGLIRQRRPKIELKAAAPAPAASNVFLPNTVDMNVTGPRKLIRPILSGKMLQGTRFGRRNSSGAALAYRGPAETAVPVQDISHAETFYLHKQAQAQTLMVFVLEGGEKIEGYVEWYDQNVIKVRHGGRTLIYKSCIKYLYKAAENRQT